MILFAVRSLVVGLGFFGVAYCLLSLLVVCSWQVMRLLSYGSGMRSARLLFGLRIFPLIGSAFVTVAFALPAFYRLEGGMDEDMGTLLFGVGTALLLAAGLVRVLAAQGRASRMVADWLMEAGVLDAGAGRTTLQVKRGGPPLLLYGISTPKVLVSEKAVALLSPEELRVAVEHEMGHLRSRDNLKKLILYGAPFPGMASLERAWQEAAEFAADEAAVSNSVDAVELASALIKLCHLVPAQESPAFTTGLVDMAALVNVRVRRLLDWRENRSRELQSRWFFWLAIVAAVPYTVAHYGQALLVTHRLTEWLIH
jgi:Zn-dependent protease with chaperone function